MAKTSTTVVDDITLPLEERVKRLQEINNGLSESLQKLFSFQKKILGVNRTLTIEEALDEMEMLLDDAVEFLYARLYLKDKNGELQVEREMCPDGLELDWNLIEWALNNHEPAIIPIDEKSDEEEGVRSTLLLPMVGHGGLVGVLVLWVDFDPMKFSREQSILLTTLSRETATHIETLRYREGLERARVMMVDVVESVPHGIMSIDRDGRIYLINGTMEFMLGVKRNEALDATYSEAIPPVAAAVIGKAINGDNEEELELTIEISGVEMLLGLTATPMYDSEHNLSGNVVVCRDLKLSREVAKLRELDSMKNDFLSLVSHELRTPLTSILAYAETLLMEGMVDTEEERREYLQIIHDEGMRLSRLINDVLDLTKMEAGKMEYIFDECNLNDVARLAVMNSNSLAEKKSQNLVTELDENLPAAKADHDRLMQVALNFLSNAVKFTPEEGTITVRTSSMGPLEGQNVDTVQLEVQDTGCGISPENLNRVFSKFEQIENIDHHSVGTGLGMPICQQIIEDGHAGKIWIESEMGKGTNVFFRIPIA